MNEKKQSAQKNLGGSDLKKGWQNLHKISSSSKIIEKPPVKSEKDPKQ